MNCNECEELILESLETRVTPRQEVLRRVDQEAVRTASVSVEACKQAAEAEFQARMAELRKGPFGFRVFRVPDVIGLGVAGLLAGLVLSSLLPRLASLPLPSLPASWQGSMTYAPWVMAALIAAGCVQSPDAENCTSGGVGGCRGAIPGTRPDRTSPLRELRARPSGDPLLPALPVGLDHANGWRAPTCASASGCAGRRHGIVDSRSRWQTKPRRLGAGAIARKRFA